MSNASEPDSPVESASEPESPAVEPKKKGLPASRIVFLVLVAAVAVVIAWELYARWAFSATYRAVDDAISAGNKEAEGLYREDLDKVLRGSPIREANEADGEVKDELFTWQGVLQTYHMRLQYGRGGFVQRVQQEWDGL